LFPSDSNKQSSENKIQIKKEKTECCVLPTWVVTAFEVFENTVKKAIRFVHMAVVSLSMILNPTPTHVTEIEGL